MKKKLPRRKSDWYSEFTDIIPAIEQQILLPLE